MHLEMQYIYTPFIICLMDSLSCFCFDIKAYLRYPLSYSKAVKLSLLYLLTTSPIIQLITFFIRSGLVELHVVLPGLHY